IGGEPATAALAAETWNPRRPINIRRSNRSPPVQVTQTAVRSLRGGRGCKLMTDPILREFGPGIWTAEGPVVSFMTFPYSTRMAVVRLSGGGLFVWSPIALADPLKRAVDALGPVQCIVSPNRIHHLFLGAWQSAYPAARLYAPPGLRRK